MPSLGHLVKMFEGQPDYTPSGRDKHTLEVSLTDIRQWHAALKATEWGFNHARCPACAGWDGESENDHIHSADCIVAAVLRS